MKTYFNIVANNTVWVLNRITALLRKRNYNIWELNLTFDKNNLAYFLISIDTEKIDAKQIANQILKLFDVKDVEIIEDLRRIKKVFYVYSEEKNIFEKLDTKPDKIVEIPEKFVWIYIIDYDKAEDAKKEFEKNNLFYLEKSI